MSIIIVRTALIFLLMNIGLRLTGKRQIGELEVSELITTLLLSELAAAPISDSDIPLLHAIAPIFFLSALEVVLTFITSKFVSLKRLVCGTPTICIESGRILQPQLKQLRMSCEELLSELRLQGIGDVRDVKLAMFEQNGRLSVFEKSNSSGHILNPIVCNGSFCRSSAKLKNITKYRANKIINAKGYRIKDVFLYALDEKDSELFILKEKK